MSGGTDSVNIHVTLQKLTPLRILSPTVYCIHDRLNESLQNNSSAKLIVEGHSKHCL